MAGNEGSAIQVNDSAPKNAENANLISFPTDGLSAGGPPSIETLSNSVKDNLQPVAVVEGDKVLAGSLTGTASASNMSTFSANGYQTYGLSGAPQELKGAQVDFAYPRMPVTPITPFGLTQPGYVVPTDNQVAPANQITASETGDVKASPQTSTVTNPSDTSAANAAKSAPADASASGIAASDAESDDTVVTDKSGSGSGNGGNYNGGGSRNCNVMGGLARLAGLGLGIGLLSTMFRGGGTGMGGMFGGLMGLSMLGRLFGGGMFGGGGYGGGGNMFGGGYGNGYGNNMMYGNNMYGNGMGGMGMGGMPLAMYSPLNPLNSFRL